MEGDLQESFKATGKSMQGVLPLTVAIPRVFTLARPGVHKMNICPLLDSWVDVPQGKVESGTGQEEEGSLTHSRSQQEMEQLLASAASDDEGSEEDSPSLPTFTIPEQPAESGVQQVSRVVQAGQRHTLTTTDRPSPTYRSLAHRVSSLFGGDMVHLLFPVLVLTHLALFGLGIYIGRRTTLVKAL